MVLNFQWQQREYVTKGDDIAPLFAYLTSLENQDFDGDIKWNFEKFLIDREGNLIRRFAVL